MSLLDSHSQFAFHFLRCREKELDDRFENMEFKLNLIQTNAKFFLEVLHHQKSNNLEWIIVALILAECILMCVEMSGMGGTLFQAVSSLVPSSLMTMATPAPKHSKENHHVEPEIDKRLR